MIRRFFSAGTVLAFTILASTGLGQSINIVTNGSFEIFDRGPAGWTYGGGEIRINELSPDGSTHLNVGAYLWQDLITQPGQTYSIQFYSRLAVPTVHFGGELVALNAAPGISWQNFVLVTGYALATGSVTRLEFAGDAFIDDVRVISTHEPLQILSQPESRSTFVGGTVSFSISAQGGLPIHYAWLFNGSPVPDATNSILILTNLSLADAGTYSVVVSNSVSSVTSSNALLAVEPMPQAPVIAVQPGGDTAPAGYSFVLGVVALGTPPIDYQWMLNGVEVPGGTNRALFFPSVQSSNAGSYTVRVRNDAGSALSLPATLDVIERPGDGIVSFQNIQTATRRPIFDVDGVTPLSGPEYAVQLYSGPTPTVLRAVGNVGSFLTTILAGYFAVPNGPRIRLPDVMPGETAYVQTRVWEASAGVSYEDARARGGKFGSGPVFAIIASSNTVPLSPSVPMVSFSLKVGLPFFTTGRLEVNHQTPGLPIEWRLTGMPGATYLIEKRHPPANWLPLMVIQNPTGVALFTDAESASESSGLYRARMLD